MSTSLGLLLPALDQPGGDALRVADGHAALVDGLAEHLLDALAREQHHLQRPDQVLAQGLAQLGDRLGLDPGAAAPRAAVLAVLLAVLRAVRLRAVVLPPLLAAALRDAALRGVGVRDAACARWRPVRDAEAAVAAFAFADVFALLELLPLRFCAMTYSSSG